MSKPLPGALKVNRHLFMLITSGKSFGGDNLSANSCLLSSSAKEGGKRKRARKRTRGQRGGEAATSSPYNFFLEPRAHQSDSIPDDERRRGEERTKLD